MILVSLFGGLGNQMFQYAAGRALSDRLGLPLVLDRRHYDRAVEHGYALDAFRLADVAPASALPPTARAEPLRHLLWRLSGRGPRRFRERGLGYTPGFATISGPVWLHGYWQSERYFAAQAELIRADFTPRLPPGPGTARCLEDIATRDCAVSLHVRRGDYVRNPRFAALHGLCGPEYYARALERIAAASGAEPVVFAFSDEPDWVRDNLALPFETRVVSHNDASRSHEDMFLMAACRHHVIANSSFSWWGAWLNPRPDKIVIAPARWFADPRISNPDILPQGWHALG